MKNNFPFSEAFGCFAEIDTSALNYNLNAIRRYIKDHSAGSEEGRVADIAAVVKADAYGHGIDNCVPTLYNSGCRFFAVATLSEAVEVFRTTGAQNCDILILEYTQPKFAPIIAEYGFVQSVFSEEYAKALDAALLGTPLRVHIKLDTGMNRKGFRCLEGCDKAAEKISRIFAKCRKLKPEGIFSHLYDAGDKTRSDAQLNLYKGTVCALKEKGLSLDIHHLSSGEGIFAGPEYMLDLVRPGLLLYGYGSHASELGLIPVMKLYGTVSEIHKIKAGETVGYCGDFTAVRDMTVATVSGGYADGILREYTGGRVTVISDTDIGAYICGRISMDAFAAAFDSEEAAAHVKQGDRVLIFGRKNEELCALAHQAGTIEYECLCAAGHCRGRKIKNNISIY